MDDYLSFAKKLTRQGGKVIRNSYDKSMTVELKSDHTPVTEVDTAINQIIIQAVKEAYPDHGLRGEEASHGTGDEECQWICDPIDGTKAFIVGAPLSTCVLGLTKNGQTQLVVIYDPYLDVMYYAVRGQGAFRNGKPIHVSKQPLEGGTVLTGVESKFDFIPEIQATGAQVEPLPGGAYRLCLLASGRCSGIIQTQVSIYDVGIGSLLLEEAGGTLTDLAGKPYERYDRPMTNGLILSNGLVHNELVAVSQSTRL